MAVPWQEKSALVVLDLPQDLGSLNVPPMLLQPLVENAIKHGLEPKVEGGRIEVRARLDGPMLCLTVRDTGVGLQAAGTPLTANDIFDATVEGSVLRLRPKLMTVGTTIVSLGPIMWATGVGVDVMQPMAAPILGGMVTSTIHVLVITPVIFYLMKLRAWRKGTLRPSQIADFV